MQQSNGIAANAAAHRGSSWVRLKFLPLDWAVDTMVGVAQIDELLKTSCGLECCHIDIKSGYRHQRGGSGPKYAYAYIQVGHLEDATTAINRMSIQVLQGTKVRAALQKPGHPKAHSGSGPMAVVAREQPGKHQGQVQQTGPQGKVDLPCPSGLTRGNPTHRDSDNTPHLAWEDQGVCVISSEANRPPIQ